MGLNFFNEAKPCEKCKKLSSVLNMIGICPCCIRVDNDGGSIVCVKCDGLFRIYTDPHHFEFILAYSRCIPCAYKSGALSVGTIRKRYFPHIGAVPLTSAFIPVEEREDLTRFADGADYE